MPQAGQLLPAFAANAVVSGLAVSPALFADKLGLVVVHGARNGEVGKDLSKALRQKHPDFAKVPMVAIVDLRAFGGLWRKVAEAQLKSTYEKLAAKAQAVGADPTLAVIIVPDWDGAIGETLGVEAPEDAPVAIAVGKGAKVLGTVPATQASAAVALLG